MTTNANTVVAFTTRGSVRGGCGHLHRYEAHAEACIASDQRGCASQGGYSDRGIRPITQAKALTMARVPWSLLRDAGADLDVIAADAAVHGDAALASRAKRAARR